MTTGFSYVLKQIGIIALVLLLAIVFLMIGLMIGYGIIGDGSNPFAILSPNKWHVIFSKFSGQ